MDSKSELMEIIDLACKEYLVSSNPDHSEIYDKAIAAILSAGYSKRKVVDGEEANEVIRRAGWVKKSEIVCDEEKIEEIILQYSGKIDEVPDFGNVPADKLCSVMLSGLTRAIASRIQEIIK